MPTPSPPQSIFLRHLPIEIQQQVISTLPLPSLLTFARTSSFNYHLATSVLTTLQVAVFSKRIHGTLALLNESAEDFLREEGRRCVALGSWDVLDEKKGANSGSVSPIPKTALIPTNVTTTSSIDTSPQGAPENLPHQLRHASIRSQNDLLTTLLLSPTLISSPLHTLTIHTTALLSTPLARALASFSSLRNLTLNFSHSYIPSSSSRTTAPASRTPQPYTGPASDTLVLPRGYWKTTPQIADEGSPAWNFLAGIGETQAQTLKIRGLRELSLTRAAVTGVQLREWVKRNAGLGKLRLDMVAGVDRYFVEALSAMATEGEGRRDLNVLDLERCGNLNLSHEEDFTWVTGLIERGLLELSFRGCEGVNSQMLRRMSEVGEWERKGLRKLVLPDEYEEGYARRRRFGGDSWGGCRIGVGRQALEVDPACA